VTQRLDGASADHYAVGFGPLAAAATPTNLFATPDGNRTALAIENMQAGGLVDADSQGTANGTQIVSYVRNGGANQSWTVNAYTDTPAQQFTFQGTQSGRCIDIHNSGQNPGSGTPLVLFDCTGQKSQRWKPIFVGNSQYEFQSALLPTLCMNLSGGQGNPSTKSNAILYACDNTPNERFIFTPSYTPPTTTTYGTPDVPTTMIALEAVSDGGIMDVSGNATGNDSKVISYQRDLLVNQGWNVLSNADGSVTFVGLGSARCLDIHNSTSAVSGRDLVIYDCTGQSNQRWNVKTLSNGTYTIVNGMYPSLCLDIAGNPQDPDSSYLDVYNCNGQPNQEWFYTPFDPTGTPVPEADGPDDTYSGDTSTSEPDAGVTLRVLPFGDSITYGIQSSTGGGYRCPLYDGLVSLGFNVSDVGSLSAGPCAQPANEGHSGWTIEGLQSIENCTITGYQPNVVLLDAGTNDVNVNTPNVIVAGGDPTHAANALESLVTSIRNDDPGVAVIVGGLIPTPVAQTAANMNSFNQQVSTWISQQQNIGWHVEWSDNSSVQISDLADGLHPNDNGYQKMATNWNYALSQVVLNNWVNPVNAPTGTGCASPPPVSGPPAPVWQAQGLIAPGVQGYAQPIWSAQGEVAPGVQASGWNDSLGQRIAFADLAGPGRQDYLFIRPDSSVLGWRNDGQAPGGGYTFTSLGVVAAGIAGAGYRGPQDGQIQFVDFSGNGKSDYVWVHNDGTLSIWINTGTTSNGDPIWSGPYSGWGTSAASPPSAFYNGQGSIQFADLDGSGTPDYVWVKPDGSIQWWRSSGSVASGLTWTNAGTIPSLGFPGSEVHFGYAFGGRQEDMLDVHTDSSTWSYVLNAASNTWTAEGEIAPGIQGSGYTGPSDGDIDFVNIAGSGRGDFVWVRPDSSVLMWQNIAGAGLRNQIHFANLDAGSKKSADYIDISPLDGSVTGWTNAGPAAGGGQYTWIPDGTVFGGIPGYTGPGNGSIGNVQLAHITASGQAGQDVLYIQPNGSVQGWALTPGGTTAPVPLGTVVPVLKDGTDGSGEIQFADMNGDGVADYLWVRPDSSVLMWQNAYPNWTPEGEIAVGVQGSGWTDSPGQYIRFADINGSGRADYLFVRPDSSVLAWYNPGPAANYTWEAMGEIAPGVQASGWVAGTPGSSIEFADLNGDGRADYAWVRADSSVLAWLNYPAKAPSS
jgi:lysophospholipase L1-like esterase